MQGPPPPIDADGVNDLPRRYGMHARRLFLAAAALAAGAAPALAVAVESFASTLGPNETAGCGAQVYVRDRQTGTTEQVSVGPRGHRGDNESFSPALSGDGHFVSFVSDADNLVPGDTKSLSEN